MIRPTRSRLGASLSVVLLAAASLTALQFPGAISAQSNEDIVRDLEWRNIGPANMAGRVTDIDAVEGAFSRVLVASASGGVWKSDNAGTTWVPIFEGYGTGNIGDVAIFQPNPDIIWVGTGESCTRNSVGWGDGVYKSTDGGQTFVNVGLEDSHHIGQVITHPTDPDIVWVAAQGHLWGHTGERGLYKTTDGGRSWVRLTNGLPDDGRTGATDLAMDPRDPDVLYLAMWERIRMPYKFLSGGPNGGLFKSEDGGESWTRLTEGLPSGDIGKIGVAVSRSNPDVVMAIVEHGFQPGQRDEAYADMTQLGTGIYRSEDGGRSWSYQSRYNNRPFYYSHIYIDPQNDERVYVLAGSAQVSEDGGRTFSRSLEGISGDFHALWIDPEAPERFYVGNDKGSYVTFDQGHHFVMFDNMDIGEFYAVTADNRDPYWVYGGLQDNGNWGGPSNSRDWNGVLNDHWFKFHSGDGFHTTVDPNDWRTVYTESQGGNIRRGLPATGEEHPAHSHHGDQLHGRGARLRDRRGRSRGRGRIRGRDGAPRAVPLQLVFAPSTVPARLPDPPVRGELPVPEHRPGGQLGDHQPGPDHQRSGLHRSGERGPDTGRDQRGNPRHPHHHRGVARHAGCDLDRIGRRTGARHQGRRRDVDRGGAKHARGGSRAVGEPGGAVPIRGGRGIRLPGRAPQRRVWGVDLPDRRFRPELGTDLRRTPRGQPDLRGPGGPAEPGPALRRFGVRRVRVPGPGGDVGSARERPAHRGRPRPGGPSPRG
jgi:photosystem II stability/assembly factor-like uncharacterized protein